MRPAEAGEFTTTPLCGHWRAAEVDLNTTDPDGVGLNQRPIEGVVMSVYKIVELVGTSPTSWEDAAKSAVAAASASLRDLRIAEVSDLDMQIDDGEVVAYRAKVKVSFKHEAGG